MTEINAKPTKGRSLLTLEEFSTQEVDELVDQAIALKKAKKARQFQCRLEKRNICLLFLKPSTRTRASFFVAASDEGGHVDVLTRDDARLGIKESIKDVARVLGLMFDGIAFRGYEHRVVEELAKYAEVPVWNALSDSHHPTQALADLMTLKEEFGHLAGLKIAYIGDGRNNTANSLMIAASKMGMNLRIVAPPSLQPSQSEVRRRVEADHHPEASISVTNDIQVGVKDCQAVYGDVWLSMGEEALAETRIPALRDYKIDDSVLNATGCKETVFLHCLPSLHNHETQFSQIHPDILDTSDELFEGPRSRVFSQAENRMHTIKAMMIATI